MYATTTQCPRCKGTGINPEPTPPLDLLPNTVNVCRVCGGKGRILTDDGRELKEFNEEFRDMR